MKEKELKADYFGFMIVIWKAMTLPEFHGLGVHENKTLPGPVGPNPGQKWAVHRKKNIKDL